MTESSCAEQGVFDLVRACRDILFDIFAPESDDGISHITEQRVDLQISGYITFNFRDPEIPVRFYTVFLLIPIIPVPKFGITENCDPFAFENDVRASGQFSAVLLISQPPSPQFITKHDLDLRISGTYCLHVLSALFWCVSIHDRRCNISERY